MKQAVADFILSLNDNQLEFFEERAAILEFEANHTTDQAEEASMQMTKEYFNI